MFGIRSKIYIPSTSMIRRNNRLRSLDSKHGLQILQQLRSNNLMSLRPILSFVCHRLKSQVSRLQLIRSSLARCVVKAPKTCHISPVTNELIRSYFPLHRRPPQPLIPPILDLSSALRLQLFGIGARGPSNSIYIFQLTS